MEKNHGIKAVVLNQDGFTAQLTLGNVGRYLSLLQLWVGWQGDGSICICSTETKDVAKHPTMYRKGPSNKESSGPKCQ